MTDTTADQFSQSMKLGGFGVLIRQTPERESLHRKAMPRITKIDKLRDAVGWYYWDALQVSRPVIEKRVYAQ